MDPEKSDKSVVDDSVAQDVESKSTAADIGKPAKASAKWTTTRVELWAFYVYYIVRTSSVVAL